jgi:hypothetical protein
MFELGRHGQAERGELPREPGIAWGEGWLHEDAGRDEALQRRLRMRVW